jgi:hypothetical protein
MKKLIYSITTNIWSPLIAFFTPIAGLAAGIGLLVLLDTILGIWSAIKKGEKITSRKMSALISKSMLYLGVLYLIFPIDHYLLNELTKQFVSVDYLVIKLVAITIASIELKSINENIFKITKIDFWVKFKELLKRAAEVKNEINNAK